MIKTLSVFIFEFEVWHYEPGLFPAKQTIPVPAISGKAHKSPITKQKLYFRLDI